MGIVFPRWRETNCFSQSLRRLRLNKWCALAFTYNFTASLFAWFVTHIAGACVCYALAPADRSTIGFEYRLQCFVTAVIVPIAAQAFVLVYGLPALSLGSEPSVFLDKVCINQNHIGLKTLGINGLETFLKYSKRMVLLYDVGTYKRLWCAFESFIPLLFRFNQVFRRVGPHFTIHANEYRRGSNELLSLSALSSLGAISLDHDPYP